MAEQDHLDRVWEIIEHVGVCMLTTHAPGGLRARPLEARPDRKAGLIWFVTDLRSGKEHEIETEQDVGLVFIDPQAKVYLSITARRSAARPCQGHRHLEGHRQHLVARSGRPVCACCASRR